MNKQLVDWLMTRLGEQSTWRGIFLVLAALGLQIAPDLWDKILTISLGIIGIINIVRKEKNENATYSVSGTTSAGDQLQHDSKTSTGQSK